MSLIKAQTRQELISLIENEFNEGKIKHFEIGNFVAHATIDASEYAHEVHPSLSLADTVQDGIWAAFEDFEHALNLIVIQEEDEVQLSFIFDAPIDTLTLTS